jgi:hypothetical protein
MPECRSNSNQDAGAELCKLFHHASTVRSATFKVGSVAPLQYTSQTVWVVSVPQPKLTKARCGPATSASRSWLYPFADLSRRMLSAIILRRRSESRYLMPHRDARLLEVVMNKASFVVLALAVLTSSQALADTDYMFCYGGGRLGLYYSTVFPVVHGTRDADKAKAFIAFVKARHGATIVSECHSDMTQANSRSDKKMREDSDQQSKFPSKLIETGWAGK